MQIPLHDGGAPGGRRKLLGFGFASFFFLSVGLSGSKPGRGAVGHASWFKGWVSGNVLE